ncbi:hypothetical protein SOVF_140990 isoform B [Spinacia oleracea]|nr:hypothetical protein SOVF_140990 isoform B [Spinacia oleracea]
MDYVRSKEENSLRILKRSWSFFCICNTCWYTTVNVQFGL